MDPLHESDKLRLRAELKRWEHAFHKQHGHKPTPADVKADPLVSSKYKQYHKLFRLKSSANASTACSPHHRDLPPPQPSSPTATTASAIAIATTDFVSTAAALHAVTPLKRNLAFQYDTIIPTKPLHFNDDTNLESVGPTPQLNGRMLGIFHGIQDQTPITKRRKLTWGQQLAEARRQTPKKSTPRKTLLISSPA
jgi:DNA replication and checkpoint protein